MAPRARPVEPPDDSAASAPVVGAPTTPPATAVIPSAATQNATAERARGRTTVQVTWPTAVLVLFEWLCALQDWDLDPTSNGTGIPTEVGGALIALMTIASAWRMNPKVKTDQ